MFKIILSKLIKIVILIIVIQSMIIGCSKLKKEYQKLGIKSEVKNFFYNIENIFSDAHLIIARAGASTISEVLFFGKPLIYLQYC